jgi:hypothetical protein
VTPTFNLLFIYWTVILNVFFQNVRALIFARFNLQFINNVIIIKTKVLLPHTYVNLA